jgi:prepilin-type N-terminal cleavage/methylation domain-containing protein
MRLNQRGLTFLELTAVMAIASIVTVGLVSFYLNSQTTWMEGSTQAIAQREGSLVLEDLTRRARHASTAFVHDNPDPDHQRVVLLHADGTQYDFFWNASDSLIHYGVKAAGGEYLDLGSCVNYPVTTFRVETDGAIVQMTELSLLLPTGQVVTSTGAAALYNR